MIYDCFIFYNELDLLEIRLNELKDVVDKFVIVEATKTFTGKDKPLVFNENKHKFEDLLQNKLIHIVVDDMSGGYPEYAWQREKYQRNCIFHGIQNARSEDIIVVGDADEISSKEAIKEYVDKKYDKLMHLDSLYCFYYFNCFSEVKWPGIRICKRKNITNFWDIEKNRHKGCDGIAGGWHFSYLGDEKFIKNKIESFSHQEYNKEDIKNLDYLKKCIENGVCYWENNVKFNFTELDDKFPEYILNNRNKFDKYIKK